MNTFYKVGFLTSVSVYLLFLFGGFVRATGSGMGCPDWPKCFGLFAPPTCECKLAPNYKQIFLEKRVKKLNKMTKMLRNFGFNQKAAQIESDKTLLVPEQFNVAKAWTEYINRIMGVLSGLFSLWMLVLSFKLVKNSKSAFIWTLIGFILLVFNAWLGSIVVATNLLPGIVSIHFVSAFMCLFAFIKAMYAVKPWSFDSTSVIGFKRLFFYLTFIIVILGVLTREKIEALGSELFNIDKYLNEKALGAVYQVHQYLPYFALILLIYLFMQLNNTAAKKWMYVLLALFTLQIVLGVINVYNGLPVFEQTMHVLVGATIPVVAFILLLDKKNEQTIG